MGLAPTIDGTIRRTWTEVSCLLQALEVIQNRLGHGCPVRPGYVFDEANLTWLIIRYTPEPGVRNNGSNYPGKALAPIEVSSNEFKHTLPNESVDLVKRFDDGRAVCPYSMLLRKRREYLLSGGTHPKISEFHELQNPQAQWIVTEIVAAGVKDIVLTAVAQGWAGDIRAVYPPDRKNERHPFISNFQCILAGLVVCERVRQDKSHDAVVQQAAVKRKTACRL
jgi:hypothetical protein